MENAVSQLQRIGLKLFVGKSSSFTLRELVPIYHRWIQQHGVEGLLVGTDGGLVASSGLDAHVA